MFNHTNKSESMLDVHKQITSGNTDSKTLAEFIINSKDQKSEISQLFKRLASDYRQTDIYEQAILETINIIEIEEAKKNKLLSKTKSAILKNKQKLIKCLKMIDISF